MKPTNGTYDLTITQVTDPPVPPPSTITVEIDDEGMHMSFGVMPYDESGDAFRLGVNAAHWNSEAEGYGTSGGGDYSFTAVKRA